MQVLEFGQRFLNYKAIVKIINQHTRQVEYMGMYVDCPYRILRFADVCGIELDPVENTLRIYITSAERMFFDRLSHFSDSLLTE